jgi:hypothetical protein
MRVDPIVKAAHWRRGLAIAAVAALHLLAAMPPALAIEQTGDIAVTARSEYGAALPGVALSISGPSLLGERSGLTGADGRFTFRALPPGSYVLDCSREDRIRIQIEGIIVEVGMTSPVPVALPSGAIEETVTVRARAPLIDSTRTSSQETYDREYLSNAQIGLESRAYQNVPGASAGVTLATSPGTNSVALPQIRGGALTDNLTLLDGVDIGDPTYSWAGNTLLPFDAMEQVQVQTGAFSAEFGRSTGGVTNVVTRSGGDAFSGTVDLRYGDENFVSSGDHYDPDAVTYMRGSAEATLGGPVAKDKLWFFVAGGEHRLKDGLPGAPLTADSRREMALGKLTWQVAPVHKVSLEYLGNWETIDNANPTPPSPVAAGAGTHRWRDTWFWTSQYQGILSPTVIVEAQVGQFQATAQSRPESGNRTLRCQTDYLTGTLTRACVSGGSERGRDLAVASVTWQAGGHALKVGVDLQRTSNHGWNFAGGGGGDTVAPDANGVKTVLTAWDLVSQMDSTRRGEFGGYYVQDEWRVHPRLTADLGLRYSTYSFFNDLDENVWRNDLWEPRLGVAWDATGDARNVFKVSACRFGMAPTLMTLTNTNAYSQVLAYFVNETIGGYYAGLGPTPLDVNGDGTIEERAYLATFGGRGFQSFAHGGRVKIPHVDELSVSYERRLGPQSALGAAYVHRRGRDLTEDYTDQETGLSYIDNLPGLETQYDAVEVTYRGQWKGFHLRASYVWSESEGNVAYGEWPGISQDYDFPAVSENRWGWLPGDTRHAVKVNGWWALPRGYRIGYSGVYYSGFPWTLRVPAYPYGFVFPEGRGSRRLPAYKQLDVEFSKGFAIRRTEMRMFVTVINVFNAESVTAVAEAEPIAGQPLDYQDTRRVQLGLHYSF